MLAIIYLLVIFIVGRAIASRAFPWLFDLDRRRSLSGTPVDIQHWMLALPTYWLVGAMTLNWLAFAVADYALNTATGVYGALLIGGVVSVVAIFDCLRRRAFAVPLAFWNSLVRIEFAYLLFAVSLASFIAWHTLQIIDNQLMIGSSVFSDFGPHLAMIRSFSLGDNFPPQYPHFPDGSLRYHFMFQFLVASFEFLGMPIDWAFNLPSILSLVSLFLLLYILTVAVTGSKIAGFLAGVLFIFRSSFAFFSYVKDNLGNENLWQSLWDVALHIGKTEHENWGLWAQNVYANQRHFAFSISVMLLILISVLPLLQAMVTANLERRRGLRGAIRATWFSKSAWWPENWQRAITLGFLLGALGFWNGAVVITTLLVLCVLSFYCGHRLELLIVAILAVLLSLIQQRWFIGPGAAAVKPSLYLGFLAEHKTVTGTLAFYLELLGLFLPMFLFSLFGTAKGVKALGLAFISPLIFASFIALTTDINANHKFIMIAVMLGNILVAGLLSRMLSNRDNALKVMAISLILVMTVTGWVDLKTLYNMNLNRYAFAVDDPLTVWVRDNSKPRQVFLTDWSVLHGVQMAGRPIYFGWPYYAWSAGYDTDSRFKLVKAIYQAEDSKGLLQVAKDRHIDFIIIDDAVRQSQEYRVNETLIGQTFPEVFTTDKDHARVFAVD